VSVCVLANTGTARAQDLEPKAYSASPVGAAFLVLGFARSSGSVLTDPTLPLTDVEARLNGAPLAAGYTFGLLGKLALVTAAVPYVWGDVSGLVGEESRAVTRSGLADAGPECRSISWATRRWDCETSCGRRGRRSSGRASPSRRQAASTPARKLINIGTNRWAFKPEVGVAVPKGAWDFDAYIGAWLFTRNSDFYPGGRARSQNRVVALQGHASYTFRPRLWAAVDATWYQGGSATVEGGEPSEPFNNSRLGATVSFPIARQQSLKFSYNSGMAVRTGTNFRTISVGYQWLRFTKR
jgi:hypothetical protein